MGESGCGGGKGGVQACFFRLPVDSKGNRPFFGFLQSVFFINGSFEGMLLVVRVLQCLHGEPAVEVSVFGSTWIQLLRESTTLTFYTCFFFSPQNMSGNPSQKPNNCIQSYQSSVTHEQSILIHPLGFSCKVTHVFESPRHWDVSQLFPSYGKHFLKRQSLTWCSSKIPGVGQLKTRKTMVRHVLLGGGNSNIVWNFHPSNWGKINPIWRA